MMKVTIRSRVSGMGTAWLSRNSAQSIQRWERSPGFELRTVMSIEDGRDR